jgi:LPS export ABC transporter protein LptC
MRWFACILGAWLLMSACENDLKDVEQLYPSKVPVQVDESEGVEILYSDSAVVKAKLIASQVLKFKTTEPYYVMPKGITVTFFDANQKETGHVTSDYAIRREAQRIVQLKKNVVVTNSKGETLKTDEMIWDENKKRIYSNKTVILSSPDGTLFYGTGFSSDESITSWNLNQASGSMPFKNEF